MISNELQYFNAKGHRLASQTVAGELCHVAVGHDRQRRGHPAGFVSEVPDVVGRQP